MKKILFIIIIIISSCDIEMLIEPRLYIDLDYIVSHTTPLTDKAKINMNGIYYVEKGKDILGDTVVGKWVEQRWCFWAVQDVVFSVNAGGSSGDTIIKLSGYIRKVQSLWGTLIKFTILFSEGGSYLITNNDSTSITIRGETFDGSNIIVLKRVRDLYKDSAFYVLAHRSGGRNAEHLGMSENSIPMLMNAQNLGASAVEMDVRRTRDDELIIFHDDNFSPRTIQGSYLLGLVRDFDLKHIKTLGRLIYGEEIPTLEEALNAVIDSTILKLVWLDIKDPKAVVGVIRAQQNAKKRAISKGRDVMILLGIPYKNILYAYDSSNLKDSTDILIEYDVEEALSHPSCRVWAPPWNTGISKNDIGRIHEFDKKVFTWTLDEVDYIREYLYETKIDGILSNYPSLVAGMHYSRINR